MFTLMDKNQIKSNQELEPCAAIASGLTDSRTGLDHRVIASHLAELFIKYGAAAFQALTLDEERFNPSAEALQEWTTISGVPTSGVLCAEVLFYPFHSLLFTVVSAKTKCVEHVLARFKSWREAVGRGKVRSGDL
jgi:hypothetical protein